MATDPWLIAASLGWLDDDEVDTDRDPREDRAVR